MEDNKKILTQEEEEKVAGGIPDPKDFFTSLSQLEASPIAGKMKTWLGNYKKAGHSRESAVQPLRDYIAQLGYISNDKALFEFVKKYWPMV